MENLNSTTASVADVSALRKSTALIVGVGTTVVWLFLSWLLSPKIDPNEPPVVKPRIPLIGHIIDMIYYKSDFLKRIHEKTHLPAVTLPMLNGKMYAMFEPAMVQSMLRHQHLSFEPFAVEFGQAELLMNDRQNKIVAETDFMKHFSPVMAPAFQGKHLVSMNNVTAQYLSDEFKAQFSSRDWKQVPNFYMWLRDLMTVATTQGLYGAHNPFRDNKALIDDIWTFEHDLLKLLMNVKPALIAPAAHQARERLQDVLEKYYDAKYDLLPDAAQITRERVRMFREWDFGRVGRLELALLHAATANVVPSVFWLANSIFADDRLVKNLREEIDAFVRRDGNKVIVKLPDIEERCPLLNACYKESIRLSTVGTNNRRVMEDTTITDSNGRTYALKKGVNVQVSMNISHRMGDIWGKNADQFDPDRFVASGMNKDKRAASHGFGGGRNLCPGRHFAYAEMMSFMVAILSGFDVESTAERADGKKWMTPDMGVVSITGSVARPEKLGEGFGARIRCREGWEDVEWVYEA